MSFSRKLTAGQNLLPSLVKELRKTYAYVSILGCDHQTRDYVSNKKETGVRRGMDNDFGYVVKMTNGQGFYEYSFDYVEEDIAAFAKKIVALTKIDSELPTVETPLPDDEPLVITKEDESDLENYSEADILDYITGLKDKILGEYPAFLNVMVQISTVDSSKIFVSEHRLLKQNYHYVLGNIVAISGDNDKITPLIKFCDGKDFAKVKKDLENSIAEVLELNKHLPYAKPIIPGVYDIITDRTITGLIAHEAFGHGVEMDQFVKDRALAKQYVGKRVAAPGVFMHDGAAAASNVASYFFDDDGIIAQDTLIIKDGILVSGMCDLASSLQLGSKPTGNGRRQTHDHKVYTRMTNTYFESGKDKLEDMIKSIKHGYMLFNTDNGMEDPKNWAIQCVCQYGREIVDGVLTDNYVTPVVMSGFVLDLLNSISMISDDSGLEGAGFCGKGYKEWVRVSTGGPALKARAKLG